MRGFRSLCRWSISVSFRSVGGSSRSDRASDCSPEGIGTARTGFFRRIRSRTAYWKRALSVVRARATVE